MAKSLVAMTAEWWEE
jgi:hypothetical protein